MPDLKKDTIAGRLKEAFGNETQQITADRLNYEQATVNKWLHGKSISFDVLIRVAKEYKVSVDWLLGLTDDRKKGGVSLKTLTYEQLFDVLDVLFEKKIVEHPDMAGFRKDNEDAAEEDEELVFREPEIDTDIIKINDRVVSKIMRNRHSAKIMGNDYLETWRSGNTKYEGLVLLENSAKMEKAINASQTATFASDADWANMISRLSGKTDAEIDAYIAEKRGEKGND